MAHGHDSYHDRIVIDPEIMAGKPVVKGTRIPVELVLKRLAADLDLTTLFAAYPRLTEADVKACLDYALVAVEARYRGTGRRGLAGARPAGG
jgi:uncharacterized protein (DUF433 family)